MKTLALIVAGLVALAAILPVFAGPDWKAIEQARKSHCAQVAETEKLTPDETCAAQRLELPPDHGPRAQTTSYLNEQRKTSFAAELRACREAAASANAR